MSLVLSNISTTLDTTTKTSDSYQSHGKPFDAEVSGTFVANLRLQRSHDGGVTWRDEFVFTQADVYRVEPAGMPLYRLSMAGVGDFTSGSATIFIGF